MSVRKLRLANVTGLVTLVLSLAAVTTTMATRSPQVSTAGAATEAHVFVPTRVALPSKDEDAAPTF